MTVVVALLVGLVTVRFLRIVSGEILFEGTDLLELDAWRCCSRCSASASSE